MILEPSEDPGIISTHIHADGSHGGLLYHDPVQDTIVMDGNRVFRVAVKTLERIVDETLDANEMQRSEVDWLIPHQANLRIMLATAQKLQLPKERVIITVDTHGNTSAASIPLALDHGVRNGDIKRGEMLLMESFGAGFTWGLRTRKVLSKICHISSAIVPKIRYSYSIFLRLVRCLQDTYIAHDKNPCCR